MSKHPSPSQAPVKGEDDLVKNLVDNISEAVRPVQERMVWHLFMAEDELGQRVGRALGVH